MLLKTVGQMQDVHGGEQETAAQGPELFPCRLSPVSDERITDICECVMDMAAALFNISGRELRQPGRSSTSVTRVRQISMYVTHVVLGLSMTDVARGFGRDRTTVQYACHLVEDLRDDQDFDCIVLMVERVTAAAFRQVEVVQ
ncbi:helix-turn-helix domain-containing protein [Chelativorans sp. YIM 93263]|uniref:helix-turn-helix domain-containing protein n=1 Tax=Chelativorans sp. YIM 93263 TaxID=2906648 RepID=UPI002379D952|nr:helix-turn-helix domain-containing protein [Chelativorans sp. YIM 93263]